jgi:hypothetical protein
MVAIKKSPFNFKILDTRGDRIPSLLKPSSVIDIFDGISNDFHDHGLFSVPTFGRVGSDARDQKFSYIDIKLKIFHPKLFFILKQLKGLYVGILQGKTFARWDDKEKEFIKCEEEEGSTGFSFFLKHWEKIDFNRTASLRRDDKIALIEKYKDVALTDKVLVLPAGLRDIEVTDNGTVKYDEINNIYMRIIAISNTVIKVNAEDWEVLFDNQAWSLQQAFNEAFTYFNNILSGKNGFWQEKYASRRIFNGTRNVISSMDPSVTKLGAPNQPRYTDTMIGMYQLAYAVLPKTIHYLQTGFLSKVFSSPEIDVVPLVNKRTLKREMVKVTSDNIDRWGTTEGLVKILNSFSKPGNRNKPIIVEGYYLGLIYKGPDNTFKIFNDIDELPENFDKKYVEPLTLMQLIYLSGYRYWNDTVAVVVRYPITGIDSIFPVTTYVKTTVKSEARIELSDNWELPLEAAKDEYTALEFPTNTELFHDSLTPHHSRLAGAGGDSFLIIL